jgi:hypothetical protein
MWTPGTCCPRTSSRSRSATSSSTSSTTTCSSRLSSTGRTRRLVHLRRRPRLLRRRRLHELLMSPRLLQRAPTDQRVRDQPCCRLRPRPGARTCWRMTRSSSSTRPRRASVSYEVFVVPRLRTARCGNSKQIIQLLGMESEEWPPSPLASSPRGLRFGRRRPLCHKLASPLGP